MHDWTLLTISYEWKTERATLSFSGSGRRLASIVAEHVSHLDIPHENDWGPSVSVNEIRGPIALASGELRLEIEMQSGDVIALTAGAIVMPDASSGRSVLTETTIDGK